jgi:DNA-binding MarR family transcriptional regulator
MSQSDPLNQLFSIFNLSKKEPGLEETRVLLYIAQHEGRAQGEYEEGLGVSSGTLVRYCAVLGQDPFRWHKDRDLVEPFKMIEGRYEGGNRQEKRLYLTDKGRAFVSTLMAVMGSKRG